MIIVKIGLWFANLIYKIIKYFYPQRNIVVLLSRQADTPTIDMKLIMDSLKENDIPFEYEFKHNYKNVFSLFRQMKLCSEAKVLVIDGYVIPVSILKHRENLKVIQTWHASGAIKKFGYQTLDMKDGNSSKLARVMHMHENYDYILAASKATAKLFSQAFNYSLDYFVNIGLPRLDILKGIKDETIIDFYQLSNNKKIVLYAPTFRKGKTNESVLSLVNNFDYDKYQLIIKLHPLDITFFNDDRVILDKNYDLVELINLCDIFISDYSAGIIDAAQANKKIVIYSTDYLQYQKSCGLNIDVKKYFSFADNSIELLTQLEKAKDYSEFKNEYLEVSGSQLTQLLELIKSLLEEYE